MYFLSDFLSKNLQLNIKVLAVNIMEMSINLKCLISFVFIAIVFIFNGTEMVLLEALNVKV